MKLIYLLSLNQQGFLLYLDESKSLEFYLLVVGLPVLVLLLVIPTIILCYSYICKKKPEAARKPHASTHTNQAYVIS